MLPLLILDNIQTPLKNYCFKKKFNKKTQYDVIESEGKELRGS